MCEPLRPWERELLNLPGIEIAEVVASQPPRAASDGQGSLRESAMGRRLVRLSFAPVLPGASDADQVASLASPGTVETSAEGR